MGRKGYGVVGLWHSGDSWMAGFRYLLVCFSGLTANLALHSCACFTGTCASLHSTGAQPDSSSCKAQPTRSQRITYSRIITPTTTSPTALPFYTACRRWRPAARLGRHEPSVHFDGSWRSRGTGAQQQQQQVALRRARPKGRIPGSE